MDELLTANLFPNRIIQCRFTFFDKKEPADLYLNFNFLFISLEIIVMQVSRQQIKYLRMFQQKKYREEKRCYLVEGIKMVNEAIDNVPGDIEVICYSERSSGMLITGKLTSGVKLMTASGKDIAAISGQKTPQEVIALLKMPNSPEEQNPVIDDLVLALDRVSDPGNLGTIIRLADWYGIKEIWCSKDSVDCYNPKVVQSSMGAIFRMVVRYDDLFKVLPEMKKAGAVIYGTSLTGSDIYSGHLKKPAVIVFGNESAGIDANLYKHIDKQLLIPNYSHNIRSSESLNVAIAAAVTIAEFRRQQNKNYSK